MSIPIPRPLQDAASEPSITWINAWGWLQLVAVVAIVVLTIRATLQSRDLQDAYVRSKIVRDSEPPEGITPLMASYLLGQNTTGITSALLGQVIRGSVRIVSGKRKPWLSPYQAILVDPGLADHTGKILLKVLFPSLQPGARFDLSRRVGRIPRKLRRIGRGTVKHMVAGSLLARVPHWARSLGILCTVWALIGILGVVAIATGGDPVLPAVVITACFLLAGFAWVPLTKTALTATGAYARDQLKGLELFIQSSEVDRIQLLQSPTNPYRSPISPSDTRARLELYERLLPYASLFGQAREWTKALADLYEEHGAPEWYFADGSFSPGGLRYSISQLQLGSAEPAYFDSTMTHRPLWKW